MLNLNEKLQISFLIQCQIFVFILHSSFVIQQENLGQEGISIQLDTIVYMSITCSLIIIMIKLLSNSTDRLQALILVWTKCYRKFDGQIYSLISSFLLVGNRRRYPIKFQKISLGETLTTSYRILHLICILFSFLIFDSSFFNFICKFRHWKTWVYTPRILHKCLVNEFVLILELPISCYRFKFQFIYRSYLELKWAWHTHEIISIYLLLFFK